MHLSVGDVKTAHDFYVDRLGFDKTLDYGGQALFVSAGGYHHHMAMNVWNSRGAGPRMPALGLGRVDLVLPDADSLGALGERLAHYGTATRDDGRTLSFDDPWNNALHATVGGVEPHRAQSRTTPNLPTTSARDGSSLENTPPFATWSASISVNTMRTS